MAAILGVEKQPKSLNKRCFRKFVARNNEYSLETLKSLCCVAIIYLQKRSILTITTSDQGRFWQFASH